MKDHNHLVIIIFMVLLLIVIIVVVFFVGEVFLGVSVHVAVGPGVLRLLVGGLYRSRRIRLGLRESKSTQSRARNPTNIHTVRLTSSSRTRNTTN